MSDTSVRVERGVPTDDELAALLAVLASVPADAATPSATSTPRWAPRPLHRASWSTVAPPVRGGVR